MGMSSSGGAREDVEGKGKGSAGEKGEVTGKKGQGTVGAKAVESGGEEKLKPKVIDSDRKLQLGGKAVDASDTPSTHFQPP
ncbi:hypothetical protein [Sporisorium scitamineum]|uniref:Uncharacterized protein n=1 Tax=Sporisorium scitamineum TaxID=49012 RepID=A0A0F7RUR7_9BASI|nr:hypothetical protein [Sporisorium scitamineum]